jgi:ubiquinone/menaquinone biosynthesis C-methylase UbiE
MDVDYEAIKDRQRATWGAGDYGAVGTRLVVMAETLCDSADLRAGERVLDVACGHGITALAAARRFAEVTGIDYVPALIERARERAACDRLPARFEVADAERLPFADASFDVVTSTVGVMFAPDQSRAAAELLRVCRPGGRIALTSWTPEGFLGQLFRIVARYTPPPPGLNSPMRWGSEDGLQALLGNGVARLEARRRRYRMCYHSAQHWLDYFRTNYGPVLRLFSAVDDAARETLAAEILDLLARHDEGDGRGLLIGAEYLEVVAHRC